jgi:hypothetical protein
MAATICVASTERHSGKTALCIGLMHWFSQRGLAVGYMKPVSSTPRSMGGRAVEEDVMFVRTTLGLPEPLEVMSPVLLTVDAVKAAVTGSDTGAYEKQIVEAYRKVADGKDVVVMEGGSNLREGRMINLSVGRIAELLGARALVVVPYVDTLQVIDDLLAARLAIGEPMMGAVINSVLQHRMVYAGEKVKPFLEARGVPVFAALPKERLLLSVSVGELLEGLGGQTLCCEDALDELVENLMVGAMNVESALTHFRRSPGKAVITGGDRVDIQLAALETSTRCLILTGNIRPDPLIVGLATERHVPIILTAHDTLNAIQTIENFFGKTRFQQQKKVEYFEAMLDKWMDFGSLTKALGLSV